MKIEDDPRFTAYALEELFGDEREIFEQDLSNSGTAHLQLDEIRNCARRIRAAFAAEPVYGLNPEQRAILLADAGSFVAPLPLDEGEVEHSDRVLPWVTQPVISEVDKQAIAERLKPGRWRRVAPVLGSLGVAAGLIWLVAIVVTHRPDSRSVPVAEDGGLSDPIFILQEPEPADWRRYAGLRPEITGPFRYSDGPRPLVGFEGIEGFKNPQLREQRRSVVPLVLGLESYEAMRRFMAVSMLPPADSIRVGELINAFDYGFESPAEGEALAVATELADHPWQPGHKLLQVGIRAAEGDAGGSNSPVAEDVQMAVEFNPAQVAGYRLVGEDDLTEPRARRGGSGGVPVGPGHTMTALYELVPREKPESDPDAGSPGADSTSEELATVRVEYREPESDKAGTLETAIDRVAAAKLEAPSEDLCLATSVWGYGLLLGAEEGETLPTYDLVLQLARDAAGSDPDGKRAEFVSWIEKTMKLKQRGVPGAE